MDDYTNQFTQFFLVLVRVFALYLMLPKILTDLDSSGIKRDSHPASGRYIVLLVLISGDGQNKLVPSHDRWFE